jgi:hypothetical protein
MIDDDFMRIVDQLFGKMMSDILRMRSFDLPDGEAEDHLAGSEERSFEPNSEGQEEQGELFDLGDSILIVVDGVADGAKPRAVIKNRHLTINLGDEHEREIAFELPCRVNVKKSNASIRNGVMEMHIPKTLNNENDIESERPVNPK